MAAIGKGLRSDCKGTFIPSGDTQPRLGCMVPEEVYVQGDCSAMTLQARKNVGIEPLTINDYDDSCTIYHHCASWYEVVLCYLTF